MNGSSEIHLHTFPLVCRTQWGHRGAPLTAIGDVSVVLNRQRVVRKFSANAVVSLCVLRKTKRDLVYKTGLLVLLQSKLIYCCVYGIAINGVDLRSGQCNKLGE